MRRLLLLAIALLTAMTALGQAVYHEASCPAVDSQRMTRMKRSVAVAGGLLPAPDCHPQVRGRYLGIAANAPRPERTIHVDAYNRKDGTEVQGYDRPAAKDRD